MNSSDFWDSTNNDTETHHLVQLQETIPQEELLDLLSNFNQFSYEDNDLFQYSHEDNITTNTTGNSPLNRPNQTHVDSGVNLSGNLSGNLSSSSNIGGSIGGSIGGNGGNTAAGSGEDSANNSHGYRAELPSLEQIQKVYYVKGLQGIENLQLLDLLPLANWKLSLLKLGFGINELRDDSPDTFWQLDGSNGNQNNSNGNNGSINPDSPNDLPTPHSVTIQFAKKVLIERISLFTNFLIDELYTPLKIQILAGLLDGWDLREVCMVTFNKPIGWLHIIFNGIRSDGVLKCFIIKLVILSNHQDGKDTHIRAIKVYGKKTHRQVQARDQSDKDIHGGIGQSNHYNHDNDRMLDGVESRGNSTMNDLLRDVSGLEHSGILLNGRNMTKDSIDTTEEVHAVLENVDEVIGFNSGFQSLEMKSISSIR